jgi:hypothetical protein
VTRWLGSSIWWIPLVVILLMGGVGIYAYRAIERSTRAQLTRELETILHADIEALRLWITSQKAVARAEAASADLVAATLELRRIAHSADDPRPALQNSNMARKVRELMAPAMRAHRTENFVLLDRSALVLADPSGALAGTRLAVLKKGFDPLLAGEAIFLRANRDVIDDEDAYRNRGASFHVAAPIRSEDGEVIGILGFVLGSDSGFSDILQVARMGDTGETYAFDEDGRMLSRSRFIGDLVKLGLLPSDPEKQLSTVVEIRDPGGNMVEGFVPELPVRARPLTQMAAQAVSRLDGSNVDGYRDYRGVEVIGAWRWLPEFDLGIATEIDRSEAYEGLDTLRSSFGALGGALCLGALGLFIYSVVVGRMQRRFDKARRLGRYEIIEKIGEGGMGKVYRAKHALLRRPTAIKLLEAGQASEEAVKRFEREVQSSSSLTHPNTIAIFDYGRTPDGTFYYAMEYLDGITIGDLVEEDGAQPEARVVYIMKQVSASLAEAHAAGMIHRDLKPSNVMLCERGGMRDFAKVLDFGLVRAEDQSDNLTLTSIESLTGTPLYLSPEGLEAPESVSPRSDVYQLGAITYYLLTGGHVFTGESLVEVLSQHLNKAPVRPSEILDRPVSADLEALILRCLAKDPEDRPASGTELYDAFEQLDVAGHWTQEDARHWWADFDARGGRARIQARSMPSHPSGMSVDFDRSRQSR